MGQWNCGRGAALQPSYGRTRQRFVSMQPATRGHIERRLICCLKSWRSHGDSNPHDGDSSVKGTWPPLLLETGGHKKTGACRLICCLKSWRSHGNSEPHGGDPSVKGTRPPLVWETDGHKKTGACRLICCLKSWRSHGDSNSQGGDPSVKGTLSLIHI